MIGYGFGLLSGACFSLMSVMIKKITTKDTVFQTIFVAVVFNACVQIIVLLVLFLMDFPLSFPFWGFLLFAGSGLLSELVGGVSYFHSIIRIGPSRASAIKASENLIIIFLAAFFLKEFLQWPEIIGIVMVVLGILIVVQDTGGQYSRELGERSDAQTGILLAFITACAFAGANTMRRSGYSFIPHPLIGNAINSIAAAIGFILFFLLTGRMKSLQKMDRKVFQLNLVVGISFTLAMLFLNIAVYYLAAPLAAVLKNTQPLLTILLSFILMGKEERITVQLIIGAVFTVLGISALFLG